MEGLRRLKVAQEEEILQLRDDLRRDEEIFAEKIKDIKRLMRCVWQHNGGHISSGAFLLWPHSIFRNIN